MTSVWLIWIFVSIAGLTSTLSMYKNSTNFRTRRYISASGMNNIKRYIQRKYNNLYKDDQLYKLKSFYTNTWAVHVDPPNKSVADRIAKKHGFVNIGKVSITFLAEEMILSSFTFSACFFSKIDIFMIK